MPSPGLFGDISQAQGGGGLLGDFLLNLNPATPTAQAIIGQRNLQSLYNAYVQSGMDPARATALTLNPQGFMDMQPKFQEMGENEWGQKVFGTYDPITHQMHPMPLSGTTINTPQTQPQTMAPQNAGGTNQPAATPGIGGSAGTVTEGGNPELTGEDFLNTVPPSFRDIIRKMASYQADPKNLGYKDNIRTRLIAAAHQYDPTYDESAFGARSNAIKEFVSGGRMSPAGQITTGNTAIAHGGSLLDLSEKVGGPNNLNVLNATGNYLNTKYLGAKSDPALAEYNSLLSKFTEEMTTFYRVTGGNESDIQRDLKDLGPENSPDARKSAISRLILAANDKVGALQSRWKNAMGDSGWKQAIGQQPNEFNLWNENAKSVVNRAQGNVVTNKSGMPQIGEVRKGYRYKGGDPSQQNSWERAQ